MIASASPRSGGCGCGHAADGQGPRTLPGACACAGPEACGVPSLERPVYSAGQLLTADALQLGQRYLEDRLALRRYVDGVGVVCGLRVRCDPRDPGWIVVEPGYAVDCCGNDLVLREPLRMDLCAAIARCAPPKDPCGHERLPGEAPPITFDAAHPGGAEIGDQSTRTGILQGTVGGGGGPRAGARVEVAGTRWRVATDTQGNFRFPVVAPGIYTVCVSLPGYRSATRSVTVAARRITQVDFPLPPQPSAEDVGGEERMRVYALRAEPAWDEREPVPVITRRRSYDPRPECRPSREAATLRLCVEPVEDPLPDGPVDERTHRFRALGRGLLEQLGQALRQPAGPRRTRGLIGILVGFLDQEPHPSVCGLRTLLCALRDTIHDLPASVGFVAAQGRVKCPLPPEMTENPEWFLASILGDLVDGPREEYLALPCDPCCERTGVRLARVVLDERLAGCGGKCFIRQVDAHPPAREALHPRSAWWRSGLVSLYDAYFLPPDEAGVLLTGRGLRVAPPRDAGSSEYTLTFPEEVTEWLASCGQYGEQRRLGLYQHAELYAGYGASVVPWTAGERVVAITAEVEAQLSFMVKEPMDARQAMQREMPAPAEGVAEPAPLSVINGVGGKLQERLYAVGIRTFTQLAEADYDTLRATLGRRVPLTRENFDAIQAEARRRAEAEGRSA